MTENVEKEEKKEKQMIEIDSEKIEHWRNLAYDLMDELSEAGVVFEEFVDGWRERQDGDANIGSIINVIRRSIQHTEEKAKKLSKEIYEFIWAIKKGVESNGGK